MLFDIPANILTVTTSVLAVLVGVKTLRTKPREKECVPRAESDLQFSLRDEQIRSIDLRCGNLEDRTKTLESNTQKRFDQLVEALADLRVEMVKLTSLLKAKAKETT